MHFFFYVFLLLLFSVCVCVCILLTTTRSDKNKYMLARTVNGQKIMTKPNKYEDASNITSSSQFTSKMNAFRANYLEGSY